MKWKLELSPQICAPPGLRILPLRRDKRNALRLVLSGAAAAQGDSASALQHIRSTAMQHPRAHVVWNAYARAVACSGSMRNPLRYLAGMRQKHPSSLPLMVLLGNSYTIAVSVQH